MKTGQSNETTIFCNQMVDDHKLQDEWQQAYGQYLSFEEELAGEQKEFSAMSFSQISTIPQTSKVDFSQSKQSCNKKNDQIDHFQNMPPQIIKQHLAYKNTILSLRNMLQQTILVIHSKLSNSLIDFNYFTDFSQESSLEQTLNMGKFIYNTIIKVSEFTHRVSNFQDSMKHLKMENMILSDHNQKLLTHIEQRKIYSEKLKLKISQLKQELKKSTQKMDKNYTMIEVLNYIEDSVDLKYSSRNDLISMIRCLVTRMIKHQKECSNSQNKINLEGVGKLLIKCTQPKKGSLSSGRREVGNKIF